MAPAFVPGAALPRASARGRRGTCTRMSADASEVVERYFPAYQRHRAPVIAFDGQQGVSVAMPPIAAFAEADRDAAPLFDYSDGAFVPDKPVPPSPISWPAGDGRGVVLEGATKGFFSQPNLREYGPFPDFFKVGFARETA